MQAINGQKQICEHSNMSNECLQTKNNGPSSKKSKTMLQKLLRLDSSPPQFLNGQKNRWTDRK